MNTSESNAGKWIDMVAGVRRRTLVSGKTMLQMRVEFTTRSHLPEHQHPHEQVTHVLNGCLRMTVAGEPQELRAGQSLYIGPNVPHFADADEDTVVLETFSPPREDLLAQDQR